jgi:hypothetical protein
MNGHAGIEARDEGQFPRSFSPPDCHPREWELDERGRPVWLPLHRHGRWFRLVDGDRARVEMPALATPTREHHGYGRPPLEKSALLELAWRRDVLAQPEGELVQLHGLEQPRPGKGRRKDPGSTLGYRINRARAVAAEAGVLPWAAWPAGRLPRDWWRSSEFEAAIVRWVVEALTLGSPVRDFVSSMPRAANLLRRP